MEQNGYSGQNQATKRNKYWTTTKTIANFLNAILILAVATLGIYFSEDSKKKDDEIQEQKDKIEKLEKELKSKIPKKNKTFANSYNGFGQ
jgi:hypothetical protein